MLVLRLPLRGRHGHDRDLNNARPLSIRPWHEVRKSSLFSSLARSDEERVGFAGVGVTANLQPRLHAIVPAQQHPTGRRMDDYCRSRQVEWGSSSPRIGRPCQELTEARHIVRLRLRLGSIPVKIHAPKLEQPDDFVVFVQVDVQVRTVTRQARHRHDFACDRTQETRAGVCAYFANHHCEIGGSAF